MGKKSVFGWGVSIHHGVMRLQFKGTENGSRPRPVEPSAESLSSRVDFDCYLCYIILYRIPESSSW
jgi:hypothetical protein